jgi:hypothetical protein
MLLLLLLLLLLPETRDAIVPTAFLASICLPMMLACCGVDF